MLRDTLWLGELTHVLLAGGFLLVLCVAARQDLARREIEDECWVACVILAVYAGALAALGQETGSDLSWGSRVIGALTASLPLLALSLWRPGAFGGGDIKLQAAMGLFLGWPSAGVALVLAVYTAGIYACVRLVQGRADREFALGPFLCGGAAAALFLS